MAAGRLRSRALLHPARSARATRCILDRRRGDRVPRSGNRRTPLVEEGARRFEFGNRLWPSYVGLGAAADYLSEIGLDAIEARSGEQSDALKRALRAIPGVTVLTPADPSLSTGIVCFEIEGMTGDQITEQLWERRKIVCRAAFAHRAVRISVAFFVDSNELETVVEVVRELAQEAGQSRSGRSD